MFYISSDITLHSPLGLEATATLVAKTLGLPPFVQDASGRWEEQIVFVSRCLGLEFVFGHPDDAPPNEYGLSIDSLPSGTPYDGTEKEVDATRYVIALLSQARELQASPG